MYHDSHWMSILQLHFQKISPHRLDLLTPNPDGSWRLCHSWNTKCFVVEESFGQEKWGCKFVLLQRLTWSFTRFILTNALAAYNRKAECSCFCVRGMWLLGETRRKSAIADCSTTGNPKIGAILANFSNCACTFCFGSNGLIEKPQ